MNPIATLDTAARPSTHPLPARRGPGRLLRRALGRGVAATVTIGLLLTAAQLPTAPASAATPVFVPVAGPVFGDPNAPKNEIITRLLDNIAHTPRGETIRIVGYSFALGKVATALLEAHRRGVAVQVVMNGHSRAWSPAKRLVPVLGSNPDKRSFFVLTKGSARGTRGVTHQKSWSFSRVGNTPAVVMVGSTNLTEHGTKVQYSDTYVYTRRPDVYQAFGTMFELQKRDKPIPAPYAELDYAKGGAAFYPRPDTTYEDDPVVERIKALPAAGTTIMVSQFAWYGPRGMWIAKALAAKQLQGASVTAVVGESVGGNVKATMTDAGIPVHKGVYARGKRIHTKLMLASYVDSTGPHTSIWTGSDNWSEQSFRNDDVVMRIDDDLPGFARYAAFFTALTTPDEDNVVTLPAELNAPPAPVTRTATKVTAALSRSRVRLNGTAVATGTVGPEFSGRTVLLRYKRPTWKNWYTVSSLPSLGSSDTYSLKVPTSRVGTWRFRVQALPTATARFGVSKVVTLRVVR